MTNFFRDFLSDQSGASAAEYALILAIVGAGIGAAAFTLGSSVSAAMSGASSKISACSAGGSGCSATSS